MTSSVLPRVLGLRDVVLLYTIAVVSPQWLSTAAQIGPASVPLWGLAVLAFFIPSGLAVTELASRYDGEGGLYVWVKSAFGDMHGFIAGWAYVVSNLIFFTTLLLFIAGAGGQAAEVVWPALKSSPWFSTVLSLTVLWAVIGINLLGLRRARRLTNVCAALMGVVLLTLVGSALTSMLQFGSATAFEGAWTPDLGDPQLLKSFTTMMFALAGLELAPLMGSEIRDPRRVIPRAIVIAGVLILAFYVLGTLALLTALPAQQVEAVGGIGQAMMVIAGRLHQPVLGAPLVLLMAVASTGVLGAWVAGTVRLPYVVGIDRHLPAALARLHPRWHSPHVSLLSIGALTTAVLLLALAGAELGDAYQLLVDMTAMVTFIPIAYLFAALPVLRHRQAVTGAGLRLVPGGRPGLVLVSGLGLGSTFAAIACALLPPSAGDPLLFYAKLVGGCAVFVALGLTLYLRRGPGMPIAQHAMPAAAD